MYIYMYICSLYVHIYVHIYVHCMPLLIYNMCWLFLDQDLKLSIYIAISLYSKCNHEMYIYVVYSFLGQGITDISTETG